MAATAAVHAAPTYERTSYSNRKPVVTSCGRTAGETTTDPSKITCNAVACADHRVRYEREIAAAMFTSATFYGNGEPREHMDEPAQEARRLATAALIAPWEDGPGYIETPTLGIHDVATIDQARALARAAKALEMAANRAVFVLASRASHPDARP